MQALEVSGRFFSSFLQNVNNVNDKTKKQREREPYFNCKRIETRAHRAKRSVFAAWKRNLFMRKELYCFEVYFVKWKYKPQHSHVHARMRVARYMYACRVSFPSKRDRLRMFRFSFCGADERVGEQGMMFLKVGRFSMLSNGEKKMKIHSLFLWGVYCLSSYYYLVHVSFLNVAFPVSLILI